MPRDRRTNQLSIVLVVVIIVAIYYGATAAVTVDHCGKGNPAKWIWTPPPHWQCEVAITG